MKRDMDLCREIMLFIEASDHEYVRVMEIVIGELSSEVIRGHVSTLLDEELLVGQNRRRMMGLARGEQLSGRIKSVEREDHSPSEIRLSSYGHDFLQASRESRTWNWLKDTAADLPGFALNMALPLMQAYMKSKASDLGLNVE